MPGRGMWEHDLYCPADFNALESGTYTNDLFLEVKEDIASTAVAPVAKEITYRGGTTVDLLPGFHAEDGSDFHAFIHPCDRGGNSFNYKDLGDLSDDQSMESKSTKPNLEVYPNPNEGTFFIEIQQDHVTEKGYGVTITDLTGRQILQTSMFGTKKQINLGENRGIFILMLENGEEVSSHRVVVR